jgi:hypothetical protein
MPMGCYILLGAMYFASICKLFGYTWHIGLPIVDMAHLVLYPVMNIIKKNTEMGRRFPTLFCARLSISPNTCQTIKYV